MKTRVIVYFGLIAATTLTLRPVMAEEKDFPREGLYGTWERTYRRDDGATVRIMKIITPTHFAVLQQYLLEGRHALRQAHGGRHHLKGNKFAEHYDYSSNSKLRGRSVTSELRLVDKKLHQRWSRPGGVSITEVWTRSLPEKDHGDKQGKDTGEIK